MSNHCFKQSSALKTIVVGIVFFCFCTLDPMSTNALDTPPVLTAIHDTTTAVFDTLVIKPQATAPNGAIAEFSWSVDRGLTWKNGNGSGFPLVFGVADTGVHIVYAKAVDNKNVPSAVDSFSVKVKLYRPFLTVMPDTSVAIKDTVRLWAHALDTNGRIEEYFWSFDDEKTWQETVVDTLKTSWRKSDTGIHLVFVKASDEHGISSQPDSFSVLVKSYVPVVSLQADTFVNIKNVANFSATGFDSNGTIQFYHWNVSRNGSAAALVDTVLNSPQGASFKFLFPDTGKFVVTVSAIDDDSLPSVSATSAVHVYNSNPSFLLGPDFSVSIDRQPVTVSAQVWDAVGSVVKCYWAFDGKVFSDSTTVPSIQHTFLDTGVYTVCGYAKNNNGEPSKVDTVIIHVIKGAPPVVKAMGAVAVSINQSVTITATATDTVNQITRFFWALDGNNYKDSTTTGQIVTAFADSGVHTVRVFAQNNKGYNSLADSVQIHVVINPPVVHAMANTSVKINIPITVTATAQPINGAIAEFYWAIDGTTYKDSSVSGSFTTTFTSLGNHRFYVKVRDNNNIFSLPDSTLITVTNGALPVVTGLTPVSVIVARSATLTVTGSDADGTVTKYFWALDGKNYLDSTVANQVTATFTTAGSDTVLVRARDNDGNYSAPFVLVIIVSNAPLPVVTAMKDTTIGIRNQIILTATATTSEGAIAGYIWALDGIAYKDTTKTTNSITTSFTTGGKHIVLVRAYNSLGNYSMPDTIIVSIAAKAPIATIPQAIYVIYTNVDSIVRIPVIASDSDGTVKKHLWSVDNLLFKDTTDSAFYLYKAKGTGTDIVYVKVMDNDSLFSPIDSCTIAKKTWTPPGSLISYNTYLVDSIAQKGQQNAYHFSGTAGDHITLRMQPYGANYFQGKVEIFNPSGTLETAASGTAAAYNPTQVNFVDYVLLATGTYTIYVSEQNGAYASKYWLNLQCREQVKANAKAITYNTYSADSVAPTGEIRGYTFAGTAGDHITLRMQPYGTNYFQGNIQFYNPTGTLDTMRSGTAGAYSPTQVNFIDYVLKATGTYTIYVSEQNGAYASKYWLNLQSREQVKANAKAIAYDTYMGADSVAPTGEIRGYMFAGTAGDHITLRMQPYGANYFQGKVEIFNPSGTLETAASGTAAAYNPTQVNFVDYVLLATGTYTIYVSEQNGAYASKYWLNLQCREQVKANAKAITYNTYSADSVAPTGEIRGYTFAGTAGDHITLRMQPYGTNYFQGNIQFYNPTGTLDTMRSGTAGAYSPTQVNFIDYVLKATGTYTIYVSEQNGAYASKYWLNLQSREQVKANAKAIAYDTYMGADSVAPTGEIRGYMFAGTAGDHITLRMQPYGANYFQGKVEIFNPSGTLETAASGTAAAYNPTQVNFVDYVLLATGTYTIYVSENNGAYASKYWLNLQCREQVKANAKSVAYGTAIAADSVSPQGNITTYSFSGTIGDLITLRIQPSGTNYFHLRVELYNPSGSADTIAIDAGTGLTPAQVSLVDYMLKSTGTFTIYLSDRDGALASKYSFSLTAR